MVNLRLWAYACSSSSHPEVLSWQMQRLLTESEQNEWQIVGTSQDMSTDRTLTRMDLREAQRAIRQQRANASLVEDGGKISHEYYTALRVLKFLQDYGAVLICTQCDISYVLYVKGLSQALYQRAASKGLGLPWKIK